MLKVVGLFDIPYSVVLKRKTTKDKVVNLSINIYRNLHYQVSNDVKKIFCPTKIVTEKKHYNKIHITYFVKRKTNQKYDIMNIVAIVDKFFCDWLVENKYIDDDNSDIVIGYTIVKAEGKYPDNYLTAVIREETQ